MYSIVLPSGIRLELIFHSLSKLTESLLWILVLTQSYSLLIPKTRMQNNITEGDDKEYVFFVEL